MTGWQAITDALFNGEFSTIFVREQNRFEIGDHWSGQQRFRGRDTGLARKAFPFCARRFILRRTRNSTSE